MAADTAFKRSDFYSIASFCSVIVPVGQSDEEIRERERAKRASRPGPKFVPQNKTVDELFDPTQQIAAGPLFQDNYGIEHDRDIVVTTSDGQPVNLRLVKTFEECNFSEQLLDNIRGRNYTTPMQIQKAMIPLIRQSKLDVMAHAQTGGGKTAAFLLPMIDEIQKDYIKGTAQFNGHTPYVIIIEPTRELVRQLFDDAQTFARGTSVSVTWAYGDTPIEFSVRQLRKGCDILVTTMGRLRHYLEGRIISLEKLRFLVLDEADKFLQFEDTDETFQAVKTLAPVDKDLLPKHRTLLFSATFMASRMRKFLRPEFLFVRVRDVNTAVNTVSQKFLEVKLHDKTPTLLDLLKKISTRSIDSTGMIVFSTKKTIVFKNGRRECDRLGILLATHGFQVITLNSTRTMPQRVDAMDKFTRGVYHILVATDVAARGLNIPNVEYVFNYDLPAKDRPLQYIHRIGRSGRAGNIGHSISFFNRYSEDVVNVDFYVEQLELSNQPVPEFLLDIVEQQREFREQGRQFEYDDEHAQRRWSDDGADGEVLAIEVAVPMPTLEQPQPGFSGSQSAGAVVSYDDDKW